MSDESNSSLTSMKQWLMTKFQQASGDEADSPQTRPKSSGKLPRIIISGGSDKSINKCISQANSPDLRRPSPLVKTWLNYRDPGCVTPMSVPHNSSHRQFWVPFRGSSIKSIPNSPLVTSTPSQVAESTLRNMPTEGPAKLKSPVFMFSKRNNIPLMDNSGLSPAPSLSCSRSELDSVSVCGACGQRKFYGSRDFVGFIQKPDQLNFQLENYHENLDPALEAYRNQRLGLRRTSSCRAPDKNEAHIFGTAANITKAVSNVDVLQRTSNRINRTGSKEKANSTISLTRSWSINLDTFRIVKTKSLLSDNPNVDRKLSLNDNDLRRSCDRRRSSLLKLLCHDHSDSEKGDEAKESDSSMSSDEERPPERNILEYSPKVTRAAKFVNGDPLDDFKYTFESDTVRVPSVYGQIKIMFQYFNKNNEFQVTILKGSNIARNATGTLGIYTKVCLMPGKIQRKTGDDKHDTKDPVFYEPFTFRMSLAALLDRELKIKLFNKPGIFSISEPVGECSIPLHQYDLTAVTVIWQDLRRCKGQRDEHDEFDFSPLEHMDVRQRKGLRKLFRGLRKH